MSFRKNWLPNLFFFLLGPLVFKPTWQPWVENLIGLPRDRLVRAAGYVFELSVLVLGLWVFIKQVPRLTNLARSLPSAARVAVGQLYRRVALLLRRSGDLLPRELNTQQETTAALTMKILRAPGASAGDLTPAAISPGSGGTALTGYPPSVNMRSPLPQFVTTNNTWMLEDFMRQQRAQLAAGGFATNGTQVGPSYWD
jgi:hypothetical protein